MKIEIATQFSPALLNGVLALLPELTTSRRGLTAAELTTIVESPATHLFIASEGAEIVGMLTLVLVQIPTGLRAHIEDVVVADGWRHRKIAVALTRAALDLARASGVRTIDLTSRPSREAAIRLYQWIGFERRDTGVFRLSLDNDGSAA
jgi:ribosomal protein S18 acetylase RimI-like enzyme